MRNLIEAVRVWLRRVGGRIGEAGFHHMLVAAVFSAPAALLALEAWAGLAVWWAGYYWGREQVFEQLKGDYTGIGRLTDVVFVLIYALFAVLTALVTG